MTCALCAHHTKKDCDAGHNVVYINFLKKRGIDIIHINVGIAEQEPIQETAKKPMPKLGCSQQNTHANRRCRPPGPGC